MSVQTTPLPLSQQDNEKSKAQRTEMPGVRSEMVSVRGRDKASLPVPNVWPLLLHYFRDIYYSQETNEAKQNKKHCLPWPSPVTALLWPLPVAILSQLRRLRFTFAFSYRFVITRPDNEFKLLPSDLVFCAIPFNISCYKKGNTSYQGPNEIINIIPLTSEAPTDINYPPVEQKTT